MLVPMLGRAFHVEPLARSLADTTDSARIVWLCTVGDADVLDACHDADGEVICSPTRRKGDYAAKINAGVRATTEPLIFLGAADIRFRDGWLQACRRKLSLGAEVVGTNDLCNPRTARGHSTHTLITRHYAGLPCIDGSPGPLYEGYHHEMVDDELVGTATARGVYSHAADAHVEHLHPMSGKVASDAIYDGQQARMRASSRLYRQRRRLWM